MTEPKREILYGFDTPHLTTLLHSAHLTSERHVRPLKCEQDPRLRAEVYSMEASQRDGFAMQGQTASQQHASFGQGTAQDTQLEASNGVQHFAPVLILQTCENETRER